MEEADSYSYPIASSGRLGQFKAETRFNPGNCLQKRSFEELYNHALLLQYYRYLAKQQQRDIPPKKTKPPVPRFEETSKKMKTENYEEKIVNHIIPVNTLLKTIGFGSTCGSNTSTIANKMKDIKVISEPQSSINIPMIKLEPIQFQFHDITKQESNLFNVKLEEETEIKTESTSEGSASPEALFNPTTTGVSGGNLDRKDMKKFEKFMELYEEYREKLHLDLHVDEKFKQLATLVIPNLLTHFKSKPFEAVAAAIVLYACREVDHPVTLKQIVSISDSKEKLINKCIFSLKEILPSTTEVKHFKAGEFIKVLCEKLNLNEHVRTAATKICDNIERLNFMKSIHAVTLAACCLKFACVLSENDKEFEDLASAAGITKMTLKNMYRELFPYRLYFITAECKLGDPQLLKSL